MRLRSSQFVFLLLLVCSVQNREDVLHRAADAVAEQAGNTLQRGDTASAIVRCEPPDQRPAAPRARGTCLNAASVAAHRRPWSMRSPALDSAAVSRFTGFLRA